MKKYINYKKTISLKTNGDLKSSLKVDLIKMSLISLSPFSKKYKFRVIVYFKDDCYMSKDFKTKIFANIYFYFMILIEPITLKKLHKIKFEKGI